MHQERKRQQRLLWIARRTEHQIGFLRFKRQRQAEHRIGVVDPEQRQRGQRQAKENRGDEQKRLAQVGRQNSDDELGQIVEHAPALLDRRLNAREVVIHQHHGRRAWLRRRRFG